jgi:hypothetical protein
VKISDVGQGRNPIRIISMRGLSDKPQDDGYPREEWIDQGTGKQAKEAQDEEGQDKEQSGDYINLEVCSLYPSRISSAYETVYNKNRSASHTRPVPERGVRW